MAILTCENVTVRFGFLAAVDDLSFEVEQGEVFGIAGPNGAGKTTLFNLIAGVYRATGQILFDNTQLIGLRPDQICRRGVARTFQIPQLFQTLSVADNVKVGAHFGSTDRRSEKQNVAGVIESLGLKGKENVIAANLNLYDKKLTMLAAAMATNPKLLLLDEPMSGLSPTEVTQFGSLVIDLTETRDLTVIIIEHLMKVLTRLSKRMMIMENGAKIALGPPEEVTRNDQVIECYLGKGKYA